MLQNVASPARCVCYAQRAADRGGEPAALGRGVELGGNAKDPDAGIVPEAPRRKADRRQMQLQVARRQVDDHPPDAAPAHRGQFRISASHRRSAYAASPFLDPVFID